MATIPAEINSCLMKFSQLLNCGINARLTLYCRSGKLSIGLNADLDPTQQYGFGSHGTDDVSKSSRAKRRQRRRESQQFFNSKQSDQDQSHTFEARDELKQVV